MRLVNSNPFSYYHKCLSSNKFLSTLSQRTFSSSVLNKDRANSDEPEYIQYRLNLWNKYKTEYENILKAKNIEPIKVRVQYGRMYDGLSWQSTPYQIYSEINKKLASSAIVAKVNDELWDLNRPLESDCDVELLEFEDPRAKDVYWHSSAHIMGAALELVYGGLLYTGPATKNGFYYDMFTFKKNVSTITTLDFYRIL